MTNNTMSNESLDLPRCPWVNTNRPLEVCYHDQEWGVPIDDEELMFEFLMLETAQAGLSWYTVLQRREGYRQAFANFDALKIARFTDADVERLMGDKRIIRNRLKIRAAINNARLVVQMRESGDGFSSHLWSFVEGKPIVSAPKTKEDYRATSAQSDAMSKDLKRRGFKFVGSTICYAHMQAAGLAIDHSIDCFRRPQILMSLEH